MKREIVLMRMIFCCLMALAFLPPVFAQETVMELSLREALDRAMRENLNLRSATLGVESEYRSIMQLRSVFDPSLNLQVSRAQSKTPNFTRYIPVSTASRKTSTFNLFVNQTLLYTGATWDAGLYSDLTDSNLQTGRTYSTYFGFNLIQPLLRNFGRNVTESNVYIATLTGKITELDYENTSMALIYTVEESYWNLVYARKTLDVLHMASALAESLLASNVTANRLGLLPFSDVLEARSGVMARQRDVLDQENAVKTEEDALKYLLNLTSPADMAQSIVPTDSVPTPEIELDEQKLLDLALSRRPDYLASQTALEQNRRQTETARNGLLPRLDLIASYRRTGLGETLTRNFDTLGSGNAYGWELGLNLTYPLGNRYARSTLEKSRIEYDRARLTREDLEQSIRTGVRAAIRNVRVNRQKIAEMALEVEVNRQKLEQEQARFRSRLSTSYLVLTYQNDLANILNQYNRTQVDFQLSVVKLRQTTGTLLRDMNITIRGQTP